MFTSILFDSLQRQSPSPAPILIMRKYIDIVLNKFLIKKYNCVLFTNDHIFMYPVTNCLNKYFVEIMGKDGELFAILEILLM